MLALTSNTNVTTPEYCISISIATAGRPARSGQARAPRRTQTAPLPHLILVDTRRGLPLMHRIARRRSAIRAVHMVEPSAEFHGLSMQLTRVRVDRVGSQERSPKACTPEPAHIQSIPHLTVAQSSLRRGTRARLPTPHSISRKWQPPCSAPARTVLSAVRCRRWSAQCNPTVATWPHHPRSLPLLPCTCCPMPTVLAHSAPVATPLLHSGAGP